MRDDEVGNEVRLIDIVLVVIRYRKYLMALGAALVVSLIAFYFVAPVLGLSEVYRVSNVQKLTVSLGTLPPSLTSIVRATPAQALEGAVLTNSIVVKGLKEVAPDFVKSFKDEAKLVDFVDDLYSSKKLVVAGDVVTLELEDSLVAGRLLDWLYLYAKGAGETTIRSKAAQALNSYRDVLEESGELTPKMMLEDLQYLSSNEFTVMFAKSNVGEEKVIDKRSVYMIGLGLVFVVCSVLWIFALNLWATWRHSPELSAEIDLAFEERRTHKK